MALARALPRPCVLRRWAAEEALEPGDRRRGRLCRRRRTKSFELTFEHQQPTSLRGDACFRGITGRLQFVDPNSCGSAGSLQLSDGGLGFVQLSSEPAGVGRRSSLWPLSMQPFGRADGVGARIR